MTLKRCYDGERAMLMTPHAAASQPLVPGSPTRPSPNPKPPGSSPPGMTTSCQAFKFSQDRKHDTCNIASVLNACQSTYRSTIHCCYHVNKCSQIVLCHQ